MVVYVMDGLSGIEDIVEKFESIIWNVQFFSASEFQMICPYSDHLNTLLSIGKLLVRDVDVLSGEYRNVMRVERKKISFDIEKGWTLEVSGSGLKKIIGQRIIWDQLNYINANVETAIRDVITKNIISPSNSARAISNFILDTAIGFSDAFDAQVFSENVAEWIESICTTYSYGWDVYIKNNKYVFALIAGTDRSITSAEPVIFSEDFENIASVTYEDEKSEYYNVGLVGGEGEGTSQVVQSVGSASGLNRFETYIDGSDVSSNGEIITLATYKSMLQTYGESQLTLSQFNQKFDGELIASGLYTFGKDYFIGDIVQILFKGINAKTRIIEMIYSEDSSGSSLLPTFSDWEVVT